MKKVFTESHIAGIILKNKIIRSATHEGLADEQGRPTEELIKKYEALAKGEVGAIITGYAGVMQNGKSNCPGMLMIDKDELILDYQKLTDRIHKFNTPIIMQIAHCGRQTSSKGTGMPTVAPSSIRDKFYMADKPYELSEMEIYNIIDNFVNAVERVKKAGFDGVQLHLAHGYLLSSFLSPHMNKRKDKWGGNTENRFRIVQEIIEKSRKIVGDYPILAKINGSEKSKDGVKLEEAVKYAKLLEAAGCDAIEVSCGIMEEGLVFSRGGFPFDMIMECDEMMKKTPKLLYPVVKPVLKKLMASPQPISLYNLDSAAEIKNNVKIPVIVVGGIRKLEEIKRIIENEQCDFVSMSRPFIIEPNIVMKFKQGKQLESKCLNCNYCLVSIEAYPLKCYHGEI